MILSDTVLSEEDAAKVTDVFIKETNKLNSPLKLSNDQI